MPFATIELARRIERAEVGLLSDCAAALAERHPEDVLAIPIAGGIATHAGADSPLNKLGGLGFDGAPNEASLREVERLFVRRGTPLAAELSSLADPAVLALLVGRGYLLRGFENVLGRALDRDERFPRTEIAVERGGPEDFERWLDTIVTGFAAPDAQGVPAAESFPREVLEGVIADMTRAEGVERWLAHREDALAGAASLRLCEGIAQLCGAATLPAHRRRGVQTALLHARLARAAAAGCDLAVMTTQPGSKSQENAERQGFTLLYVRAVLVLPPEERADRLGG